MITTAIYRDYRLKPWYLEQNKKLSF